MRKITKRTNFEPSSLTQWKRTNPNSRYPQLKDGKVRQDIRAEALKEQYYLCGHCCKSLSEINHCHNEHVEAQKLNQNRTLDFSNIIASCNTLQQCGDAHNSQVLPLTPLMSECELELEFKLSGKVVGLTPRAVETIRVLNLGDELENNRSLIEQRKQLVHSLLMTNGVDTAEGLEDDELLNMVINDISTPNGEKLEAFSPVAVNVLKQWVAR